MEVEDDRSIENTEINGWVTPVRLQKLSKFCLVCLRRILLTCLFYPQVVLASIWLLGVIIAAVPLMNEDMFGNYYGHNGVCFPLHSDRQEKPTAKGYSTGVFLGKFKTQIPQQLTL